MAEVARTFRYVAKASTGRTVKGAVAAPSEDAAFRQLKREGLSPLRITSARGTRSTARALSNRECADFLSDLGALLKAGSDLRSALAILGGRDDAGAIANLVKELAADIGGGGAVDKAFSRALPEKPRCVAFATFR